MRLLLVAAAAVFLTSCSSQPKQTESATPAQKPPPPKPTDETRRFPMANQVSTRVVDDHLLDKTFMPGGTLAHYKQRKLEYDIFVTKVATPTDAAILLLDWKRAMPDAELVPSFGGYFGTDAARPVFVFAKGSWFAGIAGLPQKQADTQARILAARLD